MKFASLTRNSIVLFVVYIMFTGMAVATEYSGFLGDYSKLQPDPDRQGAMRYINPDAALAKYSKIAITPIEIWYDPESEYKGISPDDLKLVADSMRSLVISELEPEYPVVDSAGTDVLAVRMAIANVKIRKKKPGILNLLPVGMALYTLKEIANANVNLADAVIEVELLDSATGEQLGMLVDRLSVSGDQASWQELEKALVFYARRFRSRLDAEHKK